MHLFFPLLRQRKTTFLWRNAILKVPSWLQAHNLNEMELLICQLCVHVRHPLANESQGVNSEVYTAATIDAISQNFLQVIENYKQASYIKEIKSYPFQININN